MWNRRRKKAGEKIQTVHVFCHGAMHDRRPRPKIPNIKRPDFLTLRLNKGCHTRRFIFKATRMTSQGRIVTARGRRFVVCTVCLLLCNFITARHYSLSFTSSTPYTSTSHSFIHALYLVFYTYHNSPIQRISQLDTPTDHARPLRPLPAPSHSRARCPQPSPTPRSRASSKELRADSRSQC